MQKCDMSPASTAESVREAPWKVNIQYYQPIFPLFQSTYKNAMFRQLGLLTMSGNLPGKYTYSIMSQFFIVSKSM
jgi:hypothetical protein